MRPERRGFEQPEECPVCLQPYKRAYGCRDDRVIPFADGSERDPVPYGEEERFSEFDAGVAPVEACRCGAMPGEYHHPGCPDEECPKCGEEYAGCQCQTAEKHRIENRNRSYPR